MGRLIPVKRDLLNTRSQLSQWVRSLLALMLDSRIYDWGTLARGEGTVAPISLETHV